MHRVLTPAASGLWSSARPTARRTWTRRCCHVSIWYDAICCQRFPVNKHDPAPEKANACMQYCAHAWKLEPCPIRLARCPPCMMQPSPSSSLLRKKPKMQIKRFRYFIFVRMWQCANLHPAWATCILHGLHLHRNPSCSHCFLMISYGIHVFRSSTTPCRMRRRAVSSCSALPSSSATKSSRCVTWRDAEKWKRDR